MGRSITFQGLYLADEAVAGTAETEGFHRYLGIGGRPGWDVDTTEVRSEGFKTQTGSIALMEYGQHTINTVQCYNALLPILASVLTYDGTTQPDAANAPTAYEHTFHLTPDAADDLLTYTGIWGDASQALQMVFFVFNSLQLGINRGAISAGTNAMSREPATGASLPADTNEVQTLSITGSPTGGTFTMSFRGQTTAGIAYNAAAAAVTTALEALSTIGAGNVLCAGGPLPDTPVTITFQGDLAASDVPLLTTTDSLTGGTTPASAVVQTQVGGPTEHPVAAITPRSYNVYMDNSWATLGNTKLADAYDWNLNIGDKLTTDATIDRAVTSFLGLVDAENVAYDGNFQLGLDTEAISTISDYQAGTQKFARMHSVGANLGGAVTYELEVDSSILITNPGEVTSAPNAPVVVVPFDYVLIPDTVSGNALTIRLVNEVASF